MKHFLVLAMLLAAPAAASAQDPDEKGPAIGIVPRLALLWGNVNGRVTADELTGFGPIINGDTFSFDNDLAMDDNPMVPIFEIAAIERRGGRYFERATLSWLHAEVEGSRILDTGMTFNGKVFSAGQPVDSEWSYWSAGADFTVWDDELGFEEDVTGGVMLGLRYTEFSIEMTSPTEDTDERVRLLWLGVGLRAETKTGARSTVFASGMVFFTGGEQFDAFDFQIEEWSGVMFEGQVGVRIPLARVVFEAGLRMISSAIHVTVDDAKNFEENDFSFFLGGPYVSATIRF